MFCIVYINVVSLAEGRNKHKRRTVFARFINGLRQTGDELNPTEGMQLKVRKTPATTKTTTTAMPIEKVVTTKNRVLSRGYTEQ